jgi:hypothetical protein
MSAETPARVDEAPAQRVRERRWWPALVVTGLILALVAGGESVRGEGAASREIAVGDARVRPPAGWALDRSTPTAADLRRGPVVLTVQAAPSSYTGPAGLATTYAENVLRPRLADLAADAPTPTTIDDGIPAARVPWVGVTEDGVTVEGLIVAAAGSRSSVIFVVAAPQGTLATVVGDVAAILDSTRFAA